MLALGAITVAKYWFRIFPSHEVSPLYEHYADVEGIDASFIKDFRVNDTVFVDVTLLEAKDSAGWDILCHDFAISKLNAELQQFIDNGEDLISSQKIAKGNNPSKALTDTDNYDILATSRQTHMLTVFHIHNSNETQAIYHRNFDKSTQNYTH